MPNLQVAAPPAARVAARANQDTPELLPDYEPSVGAVAKALKSYLRIAVVNAPVSSSLVALVH